MTFKTGSSPHTRGTPPVRSQPGPSRRDHPRIRGEHWRPSPSRRGFCRIIPAYAGNTLVARRGAHRLVGSSPHTRGTPRSAGTRTGGRGDHPRIRGEHVRGADLGVPAAGTIPAYAGNTSVAVCALATAAGSSPHTRGTLQIDYQTGQSRRDHPRIRGEHLAGSVDALDGRGIIPAYAGNIRTRPSPATPSRDHPRIRGEHDVMISVHGVVGGIIPAYAGNTDEGD